MSCSCCARLFIGAASLLCPEDAVSCSHSPLLALILFLPYLPQWSLSIVGTGIIWLTHLRLRILLCLIFCTVTSTCVLTYICCKKKALWCYLSYILIYGYMAKSLRVILILCRIIVVDSLQGCVTNEPQFWGLIIEPHMDSIFWVRPEIQSEYYWLFPWCSCHSYTSGHILPGQ